MEGVGHVGDDQEPCVLAADVPTIHVSQNKLDYRDKIILAPMVRVNSLPMRSLVLEYGADIVYSEELIALKLMRCERVTNNILGTIDFLDGKNVTYRTRAEAVDRNVVQIGAADAVSALKAAMIVANDVAGIDLNCGCPVHFSTQGAMGAALLKKPDTIADIISTLSRNLSVPVSLKIRLLPDNPRTVELMQRAERMGAAAVGVHCRYVHERPREKAHWDLLAQVIDGANLDIPVIANGDVYTRDDVINVKNVTKADSVMIARGAIEDPSVFGSEIRPLDDCVKRYVEHAVRDGNPLSNTKYVIKQMLGTGKHQHFHKLQHANTLSDMCNIWDVPYVATGYEEPNMSDHTVEV